MAAPPMPIGDLGGKAFCAKASAKAALQPTAATPIRNSRRLLIPFLLVSLLAPLFVCRKALLYVVIGRHDQIAQCRTVWILSWPQLHMPHALAFPLQQAGRVRKHRT